MKENSKWLLPVALLTALFACGPVDKSEYGTIYCIVREVEKISFASTEIVLRHDRNGYMTGHDGCFGFWRYVNTRLPIKKTVEATTERRSTPL